MPAVTLAICGNQISISARSPRLIRLFADYFRYYDPKVISHTNAPNLLAANESTFNIELKMCGQLPPRESLIPDSAELYSQTGIVSLWRDGEIAGREDGETGRGGDGENERQVPSVLSPQSSALGHGRFYFHLGVAALRVDIEMGKAVGLVTSRAMEYPHILANTYALFALLLWLRSRCLYHLHAAAVVSPDDKLWLICGGQRAGKTTLTTALGLSGWRPVSDDSLLVGADDQSAWLTPLRKDFHVGDELLRRWPGLAGIERRHQYLDRTCVGGLEFFRTRDLAETRFRHIDHIVLPQITGEQTSWIEPIPSSEALLRLAEQSMFFQLWRDHTARQWRWLNALAAGAQCHRLFSAADVLADPLNSSLAIRVASRISCGSRPKKRQPL